MTDRASFLLRETRPPAWLGIVAAVASVAFITALVYPLREIAPAISVGVLYMLAVLFVSIFWGAWLGILTSLGGALAFNFFHIPPTGRFTISEAENWIALGTFFAAALVASSLAELARSRAVEATERGREAQEALDRLLAANRERDALEAEAIEARALRRSDELKTALLRSVSHDLRSPLTAIVAAGETVGSPTVSDDDRAALAETITIEGRRLSRVVENLLDLSRLEAGAAEPHRDWSSIEEIAAAAAEQASDPGGYTISVDPSTPLIRADAAQLERALYNVIENAVKHSDGQPISIRARPVNEQLIVRVVDRGPGIPERDLDRVFEPFRSDGGPSGGAGLGLAIARGFVEANGGQIWAEALPGQGTSIVFRLPLEEVPERVEE